MKKSKYSDTFSPSSLSSFFRRVGNAFSIKPKSPMKEPTILYFYHIPKCGGTYTFRLLKKFREVLNGDIISFNILRHQKKEPDADEKQVQFLASLKNYSANKILLIHHHHGYPGIDGLYEHILNAKKGVEANGGKMVLITMLRESVSHLDSMVNFRYQKNRKKNFETLINDPNFWDNMTKYFLFNQRYRLKDKEVFIDEALLKKNIQLFDYIFTLDRIDLLIKFLNDLLGTKNIVIDKKINASKKELKITEEQKKRFLENTNWDKYFYDLVKQKGPDVKKILAPDSIFIKD